ncbi:unnamed protein product [Bursaphelenchus okinawaensis]|uniref:Uncharacterized protein n=1 Tax=Bursaphelenchus okinawaensis TaxID=465554 RepID=A0A811KXN2_9BILA|nr:unnamed protein product [Bursaphelenchus okinawaensis]CAG9113507.1 unnamed protein product [Bursaphelenchus okinawaensis]
MGNEASTLVTTDEKILNEAKAGFNQFPAEWIQELKDDKISFECSFGLNGTVRRSVAEENELNELLTSSTQSSTACSVLNATKSVHPRITKPPDTRMSTGLCMDFDPYYYDPYCYDPFYGPCYEIYEPCYSPCMGIGYVPPPVVVGAPMVVQQPQYVQGGQYAQQQQQYAGQGQGHEVEGVRKRFYIKDPDAPGGMREVTEEAIKQGKYKLVKRLEGPEISAKPKKQKSKKYMIKDPDAPGGLREVSEDEVKQGKYKLTKKSPEPENVPEAFEDDIAPQQKQYPRVQRQPIQQYEMQQQYQQRQQQRTKKSKCCGCC